MHARLENPAMLLPGALDALMALSKVAGQDKVPARTLSLIHTRVSQINGCAVCLELHRPDPNNKHHQPDDRMHVVAAWRDAPFFTEAERASLALAEDETRMADRSDPVPDEVWAEAARHYDQPALAQIVLYVALVNVWNRVNVTTRQVAGAQRW